jgi:hypothetical protein
MQSGMCQFSAAYINLISLTCRDASVTANQKSLGRRLRRAVDMFTSARDLVDENDRHIEALADGNESDEFDEE